MTIPNYHLRSTVLSLMYSPAWSIKDARFFTERIISREKGFFTGIAKVAPNEDRLLQGFLLVITSYSFRASGQPDYEAESGPPWVNFNWVFRLERKLISVPGLSGSPHLALILQQSPMDVLSIQKEKNSWCESAEQCVTTCGQYRR